MPPTFNKKEHHIDGLLSYLIYNKKTQQQLRSLLSNLNAGHPYYNEKLYNDKKEFQAQRSGLLCYANPT